MMQSLIFLSHSSQDKELANLISRSIESPLNGKVKVFCSSREDAIPSGTDWFNRILDNLEQADSIIILLTQFGEKSIWLGFEFGYFWKKRNKTNIHILRHPSISVPSPLDTFQAKDISNDGEILSFLQGLCSSYGVEYDAAGHYREYGHYPGEIAAAIENRKIFHPERSLENFKRLLWGAEWTKESDNWYVCQEDLWFQIEIEEVSGKINYHHNEWIERFPDPSAHARKVNLKIAGATVKSWEFVSCDGSRYLVPTPKKVVKSNDGNGQQASKNSWNFDYVFNDALANKVAEVIHRFHSSHSLEEFARQAGINMVKWGFE